MAQKKVSKAVAARAEKQAEKAAKSIEWQGITIPLPDQLPETLALDLALVQSGDNPNATFEMLLSVIGEEQLRIVRHKLKTDDKVTLGDVVELTSEIFSAYGTSEGESEASQDS